MDHSKYNHHHDHSVESEVKTNVRYNSGIVFIELEDDNGNPSDLTVQHEKEMHFIIVSNDLDEYYHLHPEKEQQGSYAVNQKLNDGTYQAFVDIAPENKVYQVTPNTLQVGTRETSKVNLVGKDTWTKERDGKTVTLDAVDATVGQEVPLVFDMRGEKPDQHLGALGHVVIVDEDVEQYIHVHPGSEDTTTFNAHFSKPGMYKIWAEFKFDDNEHVYPFIIEVKE
ncbi:hypothetical protein [Lentibacillus sp.]|uniref:hypothetical protein n=1 Tax=Lentibacillus sp. TaxID=1925746 RepID=UPI002B4B945F|nr:hypothetical protein [Lentibacillus sp.]HLS10178.1 hypothetical protein [Lentibacillus sp.]